MTITDEELIRLALDVRADYLDVLGRREEAKALREEDVELPDDGDGSSLEETPGRPASSSTRTRQSKTREFIRNAVTGRKIGHSPTGAEKASFTNGSTYPLTPDWFDQANYVIVHFKSGENVTLDANILQKDAVEKLFEEHAADIMPPRRAEAPSAADLPSAASTSYSNPDW